MADTPTVLREHRIKVTAQRIAVFDAVQRLPHGTADDIVAHVRSQLGAISRQSVYDTLGVFEHAGLVRRFQPIGSPARFEDRVHDNHHHLVCRQCGRVSDIDCAVGSAPCLTAADDLGFEIDEAEVTYWGHCPECQREQLQTTNA